METEQRNQFTFYRSYFDAVQDLPSPKQLAVLMAVCAYALDGTEPKLTGSASAVFKVIRPTLDSGRKKAVGAMAAKRRTCDDPQDNGRRIVEIPEADVGKKKKKESENEKENEIEKEIENDMLPPKAPRGAERDFESFWSAYPKKVGKDAARKAWGKTKGVPLETILSAVRRQTESAQWQRDGGQYIPNPATWLNQGRWQDEPVVVKQKPGDIHGCSGAMGKAELDALAAVLGNL